MNLLCVIATNKVDSRGDRFSDEALKQLRDSAVGKEVLFNFDERVPVGKITAAFVENGELHTDIVIDGDMDTIGDIFVVPQFTYDTDSIEIGKDGERIFKLVSLVSTAITMIPADENLIPLQRQEEE